MAVTKLFPLIMLWQFMFHIVAIKKFRRRLRACIQDIDVSSIYSTDSAFQVRSCRPDNAVSCQEFTSICLQNMIIV